MISLNECVIVAILMLPKKERRRRRLRCDRRKIKTRLVSKNKGFLLADSNKAVSSLSYAHAIYHCASQKAAEACSRLISENWKAAAAPCQFQPRIESWHRHNTSSPTPSFLLRLSPFLFCNICPPRFDQDNSSKDLYIYVV